MEQRIFELELKMEHAQKDLEELKQIIRTISFMINEMKVQINDLIESK